MKKHCWIPVIRKLVICGGITLASSQTFSQNVEVGPVISSKTEVLIKDAQGFNHFLVFDRIYLHTPTDVSARYNLEVWVNNGVFIDPDRISALKLGEEGEFVSALFYKTELASTEVLFFYIEEDDLKILANAKAPRIKIVTDQRGISGFSIVHIENFRAAIKEILKRE